MQVPPPPNFRPVCGTITEARIIPNSWTPPPATSASRRAGMIFEDKAQQKLRDIIGESYLESPALQFRDAVGFHRCIPDGIINLSKLNRLCLVEIKLTHTPNSWWQLRKLYGPVCHHIFRREPIVLEICRNYELNVPFPEKISLVYEIFDHVLNAKPSEFGVLRWKM